MWHCDICGQGPAVTPQSPSPGLGQGAGYPLHGCDLTLSWRVLTERHCVSVKEFVPPPLLLPSRWGSDRTPRLKVPFPKVPAHNGQRCQRGRSVGPEEAAIPSVVWFSTRMKCVIISWSAIK